MTVPTKGRAAHRAPETWRSRGERLLAWFKEWYVVLRNPRSWRFLRTRRGQFRVVMGALAVLFLLIGALVFWPIRQSASSEPVVSAPVPSPAAVAAPSLTPVSRASADVDVAPAPGMDPRFAPPDGPDPDVGPYDIDPIAIRGELATHGVVVTDEQLPKLTEAVNGYLARPDAADLMAWDSRITGDVQALWPGLSADLVVDVTRCTAEYVERVHARNAGLSAPPDSDDHDIAVHGRGPQARLLSGR